TLACAIGIVSFFDTSRSCRFERPCVSLGGNSGEAGLHSRITSLGVCDVSFSQIVQASFPASLSHRDLYRDRTTAREVPISLSTSITVGNEALISSMWETVYTEKSADSSANTS